MKKILFGILASFLIGQTANAQCTVTATATPSPIVCGESVVLTAFGSSTGQLVLDEDFNTGGFGPGWSSTPGAVSFSNPCSPAGVDGTPHAWMDNNTSVPRALISAPYDLSAATAGATVCFDMLFATQGNAAPCEGPDEPDEGVFLEYSIDGGATWVTINYFDPNGGNDPQLTNWNNYCFALPPAAITNNTMIQWFQSADSGADYDHWGIDNVQIFINDINSEVVWLHDGYSYGVGSGGGDNPTPVTPTATTTYTSQITTGTGQVCTQNVTVVVTAPVFDVNMTASPTTVCIGNCATISGTAQITQDPGGIETYENNEFEIVASGSASVNINVQGINTTSISTGLIQNVTINGFDFSGTFICTNFGGCPCGAGSIGFGASCNLDPSSFTVTLTAPGGCTIILAPAGVANGNYSNTVFVPVGGTAFNGTFPAGGIWDPQDPMTNLNGCNPNGVWTLSFDAPGLGLGIGTLQGWSITFDDPPIYQPVCTTWSPTTGLSNPTGLVTDACPAVSTTYDLIVDNCTPGCPTYTESFAITIDPCACTPPNVIITPLQACSPLTVDLSTAIGAGSDPSTLTYYATQLDAQNGTNPIGTNVSTSGSYWVRAEDPIDPSCFLEYEIVVSVTTLSYTASVVNENCGAGDGQINLTPNPAGTYTYSIDGGATSQAGGSFTGLSANTYNVVITDPISGCTVTGTETIVNLGGPTITGITPTNPTCNGACDGSITVTATGGITPYSYVWYDGLGAVVGTNSATITGLCADNYSVDVSDASGSSTQLFFDDFESAAAGWNLNSVQGAQGADPNFFQVNDAESGVAVGGCGTAGTGDQTLHITSVFNPPGGAAYDAGGLCGLLFCPQTNVQAESPLINTVGQTGLTLNFDFIAGGDPPNDQASVWYNCGAGWTLLSNLFSGTGACAPQGIWTAFSAPLPPLCDGIVNLQVAIRWENNDDAMGSDPSVAINNLEVVTSGVSACVVNQITSLVAPPIVDPTFVLTDFCVGSANSATGIVTPGGTFTFNPVPTDGATINGTTGEITNGVGGTQYSVEYTTAAPCSASLIQTVNVNGVTYTSVIVDESCGLGDGSITLTANPAGTYTYSIDGGTTSQAGGSFTGLSANTFNVIITDPATGCSATGTETVANIGGATIDLVTPVDASCNGVCDGTITVTASGGVGPLNYQWLDGLGVPIGTNSNSIIGLCADNYTIEVTNNDGSCLVTAPAVIGEPAVVDPTFALTDFCVGAVNAATGIVTSGGTFAFNPVPTDGATINPTTGEITNGVGGTQYFVEYTTAAPCSTSLIQTVTVNALPTPVITGALSYCVGGNSTLDAGAGYVNYNWSTGDATQTIITLAQTGISVTVTDGNGCTATSAPVDITVSTSIITNNIITICQGGSAVIHGNTETVAATYSQTFVSASGCDSIANVDLVVNPLPTPVITGPLSYCQGADVTLDAGGPFIGYSWSIGGTNQTLTTTANVGITVTVEDANNCFGTSLPVDVVELLPFTTNSTITICQGGSALIFGNNETVAAIYTQLNTAVNGCDSTSNVTLVVNNNPVIDVLNFTEEACLGDNDGTIDVASVINGSGNYTYSWDIVPDPATASVNSLPPGTYTVTVTDANTTCQASASTTLNAAAICCDLVIDTTSTVAPSCGQATGVINTIATGGDANYSYSINGGPFTANGSFTNLVAGNYQIVVNDGSGVCTDLIDIVLVDLLGPTIASVTVNNLNCNNDNSGTITVVANGGNGVLTYVVSDGVNITTNTTGVFTSLTAGNYTVVVTDANGCFVNDVAVLMEPTIVSVTAVVTNISCFGDATGEIVVTGNGGTPNYTFSIDNGVTWSPNGTFIGLIAQNYDVMVQDANNCLSAVSTENITEPTQLTVVVNSTDEQCFSACDGEMTWAGSGGTAPYSFTYNGQSGNASPIFNLCASNYNYVITDALGCMVNGIAIVSPGVEIVPGAISVVDDGCDVNCSGEISVTSNTGVNYQITGMTSPTGDFTGVCAGSYSVTIFDANGCFTMVNAQVGTMPETVANFTFSPGVITTLENEIEFTNASTNADVYNWTITGPNGYNESFSSENLTHQFPVDTGVYTICLTAINSVGCTDVICRSLIVRDAEVLYVPNTFTPDGDEFNQTFRAYAMGIDIYDYEMLIFNRWGEIIWESHDVSVGWDGTYKGKVVQVGTYTWKITFKDFYDDDRKTFHGHVNIVR